MELFYFDSINCDVFTFLLWHHNCLLLQLYHFYLIFDIIEVINMLKPSARCCW